MGIPRWPDERILGHVKTLDPVILVPAAAVPLYYDLGCNFSIGPDNECGGPLLTVYGSLNDMFSSLGPLPYPWTIVNACVTTR